jgi:pimeloyl-ACP methyl ester carboxylesterase
MKPTIAFVVAIAATLSAFAAQDSLPPLAVGKVPANLDELWAGYDPRKEPLETEILREWEADGIVCRIVRYQVGTFKGAPAKVAAFYAFPRDGKKLPGLVQLHGGGQSASFNAVFEDAKRGYASISLNWGGNKLNFGSSKTTYDGPQTDWGKLDATHPPQQNKSNHFAGSLAPDDYTLDAVESPRNSNWFLVLIAARRALTFLEQQPEIDSARLGAYGHSMGGKLTTNLAGIDRRVKAAVPSCGGSGVMENEPSSPGRRISAMELACIADNAYIPRITCPTLWLSPTNDFHAHIDHMAWNWRAVPDATTRFSISPHFNHRHTDEHQVTQSLWFDEHLKGTFKTPQTPRFTLNLKTPDGIPAVTVIPDESLPVQRVDVYYSIDPHALTRFWRDAKAQKADGHWTAPCPILTTSQPLIAYADITYALPAKSATRDAFTISSRVISATAAQLQAAGIRPTDQPDRSIDDGTRGWHDWYLLNWGHPPLWTATTRKLKDPKWRGPDGANLTFQTLTETDNTLVITVGTNAWGAFSSGTPPIDFTTVKHLKGSPDWQTVTVTTADLTPSDAKTTSPLRDWRTVTELSVSPSGTIAKDGQKTKIDGNPWKGPREIRNLRWEGGKYPAGTTNDAPLNPEDLRKNFDDAIKKSLDQEKLDRK